MLRRCWHVEMIRLGYRRALSPILGEQNFCCEQPAECPGCYVLHVTAEKQLVVGLRSSRKATTLHVPVLHTSGKTVCTIQVGDFIPTSGSTLAT